MRIAVFCVAIVLTAFGQLAAQNAAPAAPGPLATAVSLVPTTIPDRPGALQLQAGQKIVAIGDSITAGGGYLRQIDAVLARNYGDLKIAPVVNKGISGQKAEDLVKRFDKDVVSLKPAFVTLSIGINDVWHRLKAPHDQAVLDAYAENLGKMVNMAQAAGIKVIMLAPTVIGEDANSEGNRRLPMYVAAMKKVAADKKCQFVDLHGMFLAALAKKPADAKGNWLTGDGVHMNATGNAIMAVGVLRALGVPDEKIAATTLPPPPPHASRPAKTPVPK